MRQIDYNTVVDLLGDMKAENSYIHQKGQYLKHIETQ